ncbi:hypothetical protein [Streptomyces sp. NPDC056821]|uniref:hypothetical protein n=1 Tax=unclassified Streptomyces TaxID=2593676 RepID=UPI0036892C51
MSSDAERVLALLALAAESDRADIECFIDDLDVDGLVGLVAGLAEYALGLLAPNPKDPVQRAALCARLRAQLLAHKAADGP